MALFCSSSPTFRIYVVKICVDSKCSSPTHTFLSQRGNTQARTCIHTYIFMHIQCHTHIHNGHSARKVHGLSSERYPWFLSFFLLFLLLPPPPPPYIPPSLFLWLSKKPHACAPIGTISPLILLLSIYLLSIYPSIYLFFLLNLFFYLLTLFHLQSPRLCLKIFPPHDYTTILDYDLIANTTMIAIRFLSQYLSRKQIERNKKDK